MTIGFDAKRAFLNSSGLGNYSRSVIESLAQYYSDENYFLFTPAIKLKLFDRILIRKNIEIIKSDSFSKFYWRSFSQVKKWNNLQLDIYHGLSSELPFGLSRTKSKKIITVHDVIYKKHPEYYSYVDRSIYDFKTKHACRYADKIICISEQTKRDVIRYYKVAENKIKVIYPSLPEHITRLISISKAKEVKKKFNLPEKFILYTGTIEQRKNLLTVIKALNKMGESAPCLVAVGKATEYLNDIKKYIHSTASELKISFIHNADNEDLNVIYSLAHVFIYTSLFEGFGIPLIEAASHGVPSITTKDSCMEEAAGGGALTIDSKSINETANAIEKLMNDSILHKQLSAMAIAHAAKFNSKNSADELMKTYTSL